MLINRWKKDKDKDKSSNSAQNVSSGSLVGGGGVFANSMETALAAASSKSSFGSVKKKRKALATKDENDRERCGGDSKSKGGSVFPAGSGEGNSRNAEDDLRKSRSSRREDPRRHTLSCDHHLGAVYHYGVGVGVGGVNVMRNTDFESPLSRGYAPTNSILFDDDPGIMSEVETSSTGFRRGNKQRSSLPVVRTPSKTLERPLGLVFLQYRNETKRSLLPNEITSLDTVKALFVRSFPKQLSMEYLDSPSVRIYIHDSNKDMFYELEDLRSHLNEIRDRSVLRLFESADIGGDDTTNLTQPLPSSLFPLPTATAFQMCNESDQSYFSEPEFDSEFQHQHIHKSKAAKSNFAHPPYYMTHSFPPGSSATIPRSGSILRPFSPVAAAAIGAPVTRKTRAGFISPSSMSGSPERVTASSSTSSRSYAGSYVRSIYEDSYFAPPFGPGSSSISTVIDEETSDTEFLDDISSNKYHIFGGAVKCGTSGGNSSGCSSSVLNRASTKGFNVTPSKSAVPALDATRLRVEHMERQLANLTGLVQKALTQGTSVPSSLKERDLVALSDLQLTADLESKPSRLSKDKSVSFEKSVSFSDDPPEINSPKQHSPQHTDTKPSKPAIKSSTLPRTSSQERERLKPVPPPKPLTLSPAQYDGRTYYQDLQLTPEMYNHLRTLQKKAKDLRRELRNLRRMSQAQARSVKETVRDAYIKIRSVVLSGGESLWSGGADSERIKISREEDIYKQDILKLETDLTELENTVEELRSSVINRKTRVNITDVENMALILSKSSKTVADLKLKFPLLQNAMKSVMAVEVERVVTEEAFLKEEPERLESALKRCKKLTGTLVTLKRLASVQEQRLPDNRLSPTIDDVSPLTPTSGKIDGATAILGCTNSSGGSDEVVYGSANTFDSLLEELLMNKCGSTGASVVSNSGGTLRRLHSFPTSENKPPLPERLGGSSGGDSLTKRVPPPPPPRTSSKSPLASPTNPNIPISTCAYSKDDFAGRNSSSAYYASKATTMTNELPSASSSSCESINSQEGVQQTHSRHEQLELRHRELLKKQKALQEQYSRLQHFQKTSSPSSSPDLLLLKKTGSENNILAKIGFGFGAAAAASAVASTAAPVSADTRSHFDSQKSNENIKSRTRSSNVEAKVYETDIL